MLAALGDGNYDVGARAREIRDRLREREQFTPRRHARHPARRARHVPVAVARPDPAPSQHRHRRRRRGAARAFREIVEKDWTGEASPDSAAYLLTRDVPRPGDGAGHVVRPGRLLRSRPGFDYTWIRRREGAIWKLVTERPPHLLNPRYGSWTDLLTASIDALIQDAMENSSGDLARRKWSDYNVIQFRHPLSGSLPFVSRWLDMPEAKLPGDAFTPRVHWNISGASERMVVSPGNEREGLMHMPTGQSGHPLSPFYGNSHDAWARGEPTPFMPGPTRYTLTLAP